MNFTCRSLYRQKELTALSRALRKTVRKKSHRKFQIYGWLSIGLGIFVVLSTRHVWVRWLDSAVIIMMLAVFLWGDAIDGFFARKMAPRGTEAVTLSFSPEGYTVDNGSSVTRWSYEQVLALAETREYILLILGNREGEICEKAGLQGGTPEEFRRFLAGRTQKEILYIGR